jgi:hypothetical protein
MNGASPSAEALRLDNPLNVHIPAPPDGLLSDP